MKQIYKPIWQPYCNSLTWTDGKTTLTCKHCKQEFIVKRKNVHDKWLEHYKRTGKTNWSYQCYACSGGSWKGGKKFSRGYVYIHKSLVEEKFQTMIPKFFPYVAEHRLIMARYLDKPIEKHVHVHHRNNNKADNRVENLEVIDPTLHRSITWYVAGLLHRIEELEGKLNERCG